MIPGKRCKLQKQQNSSLFHFQVHSHFYFYLFHYLTFTKGYSLNCCGLPRNIRPCQDRGFHQISRFPPDTSLKSPPLQASQTIFIQLICPVLRSMQAEKSEEKFLVYISNYDVVLSQETWHLGALCLEEQKYYYGSRVWSGTGGALHLSCLLISTSSQHQITGLQSLQQYVIAM